MDFDPRAITEPSQEIFAILPAQPKLGHIGQAKPPDNVTEECNVIFLEFIVHHRPFCPVHQFSLRNPALQMGRKLFGDGLACDVHRFKLHVLVAQIERKFLVSRYELAFAIINLLPKNRGILRHIYFLVIPCVATGPTANLLQLPAPAAGQVRPAAKFASFCLRVAKLKEALAHSAFGYEPRTFT